MATAGFSFDDVVLVPFPFTEQTAVKRRPAVIVSSGAYNTIRRDMAIVGSMRPLLRLAMRLAGLALCLAPMHSKSTS